VLQVLEESMVMAQALFVGARLPDEYMIAAMNASGGRACLLPECMCPCVSDAHLIDVTDMGDVIYTICMIYLVGTH
jgi:hypothetical protein